MRPSKWCEFEDVEEVEVRGQGFTGNLVMENASCTFRTEDNEYYGEPNIHTLAESNQHKVGKGAIRARLPHYLVSNLS